MNAHNLRSLWITTFLLIGSCTFLLAACGGTANPNTDASTPISTPKPTTTHQIQQHSTPTPTSSTEDNTLQVKTGTIQPLEVSAFMYGTHILVDKSGKILYALHSHTLDLSAYIGKQVEVSGTLVPGYPVEGGPPYLEVSKVREI